MNKMMQQGVGLVEVMVAMLILALAILGFITMQVRATISTEEALKRADALIILNGLAEKIRLNRGGDYDVAIPEVHPKCKRAGHCDTDEQVLLDLFMQQQFASSKAIQLGVDHCPNTSDQQTRLCLMAAWNETLPIIAAQDQPQRCLNDDSMSQGETTQVAGRYAGHPSCLVLEAY